MALDKALLLQAATIARGLAIDAVRASDLARVADLRCCSMQELLKDTHDLDAIIKVIKQHS